MASEVNNECCRICGNEANDACSSCKDALYCSKACQRWDWKTGGHKALCRGPALNRKINAVVRDLFSAEWKWLKSLSREDRIELFRERTRSAPLNYLSLSGQVALVLARANACALMTSNICTEEYGSEYFAKVLSPWYDKYMDFLNEEGFVVEYISHEVYLADFPCDCTALNGRPCGELFDFARGGAALVKETRSPKMDLVDKVFGVERPLFLKNWKDEEKTIMMQDFNECINYRQSDEVNSVTASGIQYFFQYHKQVFPGNENLCCSPCLALEFAVDENDADSLGEHFHKCYEALARIGLFIELVVMHLDDWPDKAFAEAWWAAAGKDRSTFEKWIMDDHALVSRRLDRERALRVISLVDEIAEASES